MIIIDEIHTVYTLALHAGAQRRLCESMRKAIGAPPFYSARKLRRWGLGCERCAVVKTATKLYVRSTTAGIWSELIVSHDAHHPSNARVKPDHQLYAGMRPRGVHVPLPINNLFVAVANSGECLSLHTREEMWTECFSASAMLVDATAVQCEAP